MNLDTIVKALIAVVEEDHPLTQPQYEQYRIRFGVILGNIPIAPSHTVSTSEHTHIVLHLKD